MTAQITRAEWLAELERVLTEAAEASADGWTIEELVRERGHTKEWWRNRLARIGDRLIVGRKRVTRIDLQTGIKPCYRLKPEARDGTRH
jgi:hypothetical protein